MPVRSLNASVLRWPDAATVDQSVRRWAEKVISERPEVVRIGYFGSYARGDWTVGSDLDLIVIVETSPDPFTARAAQWDITPLPVPTDLLIYTTAEWQSLARQGRFYPTVQREAVWIYERSERNLTAEVELGPGRKCRDST